MSSTTINQSKNIEPEIDFMPQFKKEESYFKNQRTKTGRQWPHVKSPEQRHYENWLAEVVDPMTGEFYKNNEGETARYYVDKIVRYKDLDGKEFLYSIGQVRGFNSFKDPKTISCYRPEVHKKTIFGSKTDVDNKKGRNQIVKVSTGPERVIEVYDLPFNEENAEKLWNLKRNRNIQLILKDEMTGESHNLDRKGLIGKNDLKKAFEFFKSKPFDYLYNWEYTAGTEDNNNNNNNIKDVSKK